MRYNTRSYRNHDLIQRYCRYIDDNTVGLYDDPDDSKDFVWFYIEGRMVDYTIDTHTRMIVEGTTLPSGFEEYWQFTRTPGGGWVLNRILQKDEAEQIPFSI